MYIHKGSFTQRGRGLGNIFGALLRAVIPVGKSILKSPITKSILTTAKDTAIQGGISLAADALRGGDVGESLKQNLNVAKTRMADTLESAVANRNRPATKKKRPARRGGARKRFKHSSPDLLS